MKGDIPRRRRKSGTFTGKAANGCESSDVAKAGKFMVLSEIRKNTESRGKLES